MKPPPFLIALHGFLRRHGPNCQGRKGEQFQTDIRLPEGEQAAGSMTFRCSCGWQTETPAEAGDARTVGIVMLLLSRPLTITKTTGVEQ